jgi:hypothetical protein
MSTNKFPAARRLAISGKLERRAASKPIAPRAAADPLSAAAGYARGLLAAALDVFDQKAADPDGVTADDVSAFHGSVVAAFDALNEALAPAPSANPPAADVYPTAWLRR